MKLLFFYVVDIVCVCLFVRYRSISTRQYVCFLDEYVVQS